MVKKLKQVVKGSRVKLTFSINNVAGKRQCGGGGGVRVCAPQEDFFFFFFYLCLTPFLQKSMLLDIDPVCDI